MHLQTQRSAHVLVGNDTPVVSKLVYMPSPPATHHGLLLLSLGLGVYATTAGLHKCGQPSISVCFGIQVHHPIQRHKHDLTK
jgi:hypothetical protein